MSETDRTPTQGVHEGQSLTEGEGDVATFIGVNRKVFDAMQTMLFDAHMIELGQVPVKRVASERRVRLVGGPAQVGILVALARENGLGVHHTTETDIVVDAPNRQLSLVVACDFNARDSGAAIASG